MRIFIALQLAVLGFTGLSASTNDIPLFHSVRWGMSVRDVKALEKSAEGVVDEFEMDGETTLGYRTAFSDRQPLPVLATYFFYQDRLYSILAHYRSTNESDLVESYRETVAVLQEQYGKPKIADVFRNLTAWETNGTVVTASIGPVIINTRRVIFSVQYDSPESPDIRLRLEKTRNEEFRKKELLEDLR